MDFLYDPNAMTPKARLKELAAILAVGYLRLPEKGLASEREPSGCVDRETRRGGRHEPRCAPPG